MRGVNFSYLLGYSDEPYKKTYYTLPQTLVSAYNDDLMKIRIQKYLSQQGILSRRKAELYLQKGWISVNGVPVTELGTQIDPEVDVVTLDPVVSDIRKAYQYIAFHKPKGVVTNCPLPGEQEILDLLPAGLQYLSSVGRLDKESEGLILLTDDGVFANACLNASPPHTRIYEVATHRTLLPDEKDQLENGLMLMGKKTLPLTVTQFQAHRFYMTMGQGKNRQIRKMLQSLGLVVRKLIRLEFAHIKLGELRPGEYRHLSDSEIAQFLAKNSTL